MKSKYVVFITIFCFVLGLGYYLVQQKRLVVFFNFQKSSGSANSTDLSSLSSKQATITLYTWKDDKLSPQEGSVVWGSSISDNLKHLINCWLNVSYQNQVLDKKVVVKAVSFSQSGQEAYVSFDSSPLSASWSIHKKWQVLESLLKTIRESGINLNMIFFHEKHLPLEDEHLDFSQGWPITGYSNN